MPVDGVVISAIKNEFEKLFINGKIDKIYQPHRYELMFSIRNNHKSYKLFASAASNNPRIHITDYKKSNPQTPPMFCMLMRKHLTGGKIIDISQPDFERILIFSIETYNELGDLVIKKLVIEVMGRHSNIILLDSNGKIIDCIKHVDITVSRLRQVLPGIDYTFPPSQNKINPLDTNKKQLVKMLQNTNKGILLSKFFVKSFTGISPLIGREISFLSLADGDKYIEELNDNDMEKITYVFNKIFTDIKNNNYEPIIIYDNDVEKLIDFYSIYIYQYKKAIIKTCESISKAMDKYYYNRDYKERLRQKCMDLSRIIKTNLDRCNKKLIIQKNKLKDTENKEEYKKYGDLITANIYRIKQGMDKITVDDFYSNSDSITILLDPKLTPSQNAQRYYKKYNKAKNAQQAVTDQLSKNINEIEYLESILDSINKIDSFEEYNEIRDELYQECYIKRHKIDQIKDKKKKKNTKPKKFVSSKGFDIYVGKNNKQNDYLTLKFAKSQDIWFHTKGIPGSHVVIKTDSNKDNIDDKTIYEASVLAAYFSKAKASSNVPVDYTTVKNVKKPSGAKPGMVIYENYKTAYVTPDISIIKKLEKNRGDSNEND